jgi:sialate O-acetylesterase
MTVLLLLLLAEVKLHPVFSEGMVLQRDQPCPVWGTSAPGEDIVVALAGREKSAKAGADGRWSLKLDPLPAGGPHELKVNGTVVRDVMIGEVWLAAGGTNMEMPLKAAQIGRTQPDDGPVPMIRFFVVPSRRSEQPEKDVQATWRTSRSETVSEVSASAYFFAREIQQRLKVPVGILQATAGNTAIEQWIGLHSIQASPGMSRSTLFRRLEASHYELVLARYRGSVQRAEEARAKGEPAPPILPQPVPPPGTSGIYNAMIAPIMPYGMKGAIFDQGEADLFRTLEYPALFSGLVQSWRSDWGQGEFPFGFVQLAVRGDRRDAPEDTATARIRESQARALRLPGVGMAVSIDLGDPRNKEDVGLRLALWAEARVYGKSGLVSSGPIFESMKSEGSKIRLRFKNVGSGLQAKDDVLRGFTISGEFRRFIPASAAIEGDTVVVWSEGTHWPAAVRYAWADNPDCTLFNKEGLPAAPFRTDDW